jgi:hypothetical protein
LTQKIIPMTLILKAVKFKTIIVKIITFSLTEFHSRSYFKPFSAYSFQLNFE